MPLPQRRMTVRDLLTPGQMDGNSLEYVKETGFTNNAAMVAEGAAKPSSDIQLDLITTSAKVIAHYMKASRQVLSDIAQLKSVIDQRLLYGLAYKEETQLLNGDGTGQNLRHHPAGHRLRGADPRWTHHHDRRDAPGHAAGRARRVPGDGPRHAPDRLGRHRDPQGRPGPLPDRQPAGHHRPDPLAPAGGRPRP
jgi:hypothetical protein